MEGRRDESFVAWAYDEPARRWALWPRLAPDSPLANDLSCRAAG